MPRKARPAQSDIAQALGVSVATVRNLVSDGAIPKGDCAMWEVTAHYCSWLRQRSAGGAADKRARLDEARTEEIELRLAVRRAELVEASEVESRWVTIATEVKTRMLALPTRLAPLVIGCQRVRDAEAVLRDGVDDALGALGPGD